MFLTAQNLEMDAYQKHTFLWGLLHVSLCQDVIAGVKTGIALAVNGR